MKKLILSSGIIVLIVNLLFTMGLFGQTQLTNKSIQLKNADNTNTQILTSTPQQNLYDGFFEIQREFNEYWDPYNVDNTGYYIENGEKKKAAGWKQFKRWEWFWENRIDPTTGEFPTVSAAEIYEQESGARSVDGNWTSLGPNSSTGGYAGIGRINCVVEQPVTGDLYAGSPSGGLWKSTDDGATWTVLTDDNAVLGVSAIVVVPTGGADIIYIGTGDRDGGSMWSLNGGQSNDNNSIGVLKSTDGGSTWFETGLTYSASQKETINKLLKDPNDDDLLYAATSDGIYKTTDGGVTWTHPISGGGLIDMEFKPGNSLTMYASQTYGRIYMTTDGWNTLTNVFDNSASGGRRIELAVSPAQPNWVYAVEANTSGALFGIYKSTTSGSSGSFSQIFDGSTKNMLGWYCLGTDASGQGSYDLCIAVNPTNANTVYIGGVNTWKSTNGGTSWSSNNVWTSNTTYNSCGSPVVHADKHNLDFFGSTLYECNDGGLYKTTDGGTSWSNISNGMVISQIYRLSVAQTTSNEVMTGLQDNGSKLLWAGTWYDVQGGDGMECLIDFQNINNQYGTYPRGTIMQTTAHWSGNETDITPPTAGTGAWVTPFIIDPNDYNTLFAGYADIWKTTNQGTNWTQISTINNTDYFRSLAIAPSNSNYIYAAGRNILYKTVVGGTTWTNITSNLPISSSYITYISVKNNDPNTVWVSMGEYNSYCVYETTNGGTTWTNISSGLPNIPVMCVIQNKLNTTETELYAGTDVGIYAKIGSGDWFSFNHGLPNVVVTELEIYYDNVTPANSKLRAATFGRGLWESDLFTAPTTPPSISNVSPSTLYEDKGKQLTITGSNLAASTFEIGGISGSIVSNDGTTAIVDFPPANYSNGTLTSTNAAGNGTYMMTVSTRNTIPVDASTGPNTDIHQTIVGAVDGLAAWYGSTAFSAGDFPGTKTIEVASGTYNESITLNPTLNPTATNKLVIKPSTGALPVVNASGKMYGFDLSTVDNTELVGFTVHGASTDNIFAQGDNVLITLNKCYGSIGGSGIRAQTGTPFTIMNNLCYGNYKYGIHLYNTNNAIIKNNTTDDNGGSFSPAIGVNLFDEDWESGSYTGWTVSGGWNIYDDPTVARSPTHCAEMTNYTAGYLNYSSVNIYGYTNIVVSCWYRDDSNMEAEDNIKGEYQIDGGGWIQFFSKSNDVDSYLQGISSAISTGGTSNLLEIRFTATCNSAEYWVVDDISVTGDEAAPGFNSGAGLYVESGTGTSVQNNIFQAKPGNNAYYTLITESGVTVNSDYNTYYTANTNLFDYNGTVGNTGPLGANDLTVDPKFIGSGDYHVFSSNDSYHGGEWPPLTASSGTWTSDASDSPALDTGNPADDYSNEVESGYRINQGAYGNTIQASKSGVVTVQWTGTTSTNWVTTSNWNPAVLPIASTDITIPTTPSGPNFPVIELGDDAFCNDLTIQTDANIQLYGTLTVDGTLTNNASTAGLVVKSNASGTGSLITNTNNVDVTVERYFVGGRWHLFGAPVANQTANAIFFNHDPDVWFKNYIENTDSWSVTISDLNTSLPMGKGFALWVKTGFNATSSFEDQLNSVDFLVNGLEYTDASHGFNLLANPFAAALDWDQGSWVRTNLDGSVWVYDKNISNYRVRNSVGIGNLTNGIIPSSQGFFVRTTASGGSISIPANARVHSNQAFYKNSSNTQEDKQPFTLAAINVSKGEKTDETWFIFNEACTNSYDNGWDVYKFFGDSDAPQLYAVEADDFLSVDALPVIHEEIIVSLDFIPGEDGDHLLTLKCFENFEGTELWLEDVNEETLQEFTENPEYNFYASIGNSSDRFLLHFIPQVTGIIPNSESNYSIYSWKNSVYIKNPELESNATVEIVDIYGRIIYKGDLKPVSLNKIDLNLSNSYLVVKLTYKGTATVQKVFIR